MSISTSLLLYNSSIVLVTGNPLYPCLHRRFSRIVNFPLSKDHPTKANQPKLPAMGFGVEDYQGSSVNPDNLVDYGFAHAIATKSVAIADVMQLHYCRGRVKLIGLEVLMTEALTPLSESSLTDRYQTTIPETVRKVLGLSKRDKIQYTIQSNGQVIISRAESSQSDPILEQFLVFLAQDIEKNPQHLQALSVSLVSRVQSLVSGVDVDLDEPLLEEADEQVCL